MEVEACGPASNTGNKVGVETGGRPVGGSVAGGSVGATVGMDVAAGAQAASNTINTRITKSILFEALFIQSPFDARNYNASRKSAISPSARCGGRDIIGAWI
jgi:hypothetical protein